MKTFRITYTQASENTVEIEDEMHFVMACKGYIKQRRKFFTEIAEKNNNFQNLIKKILSKHL